MPDTGAPDTAAMDAGRMDATDATTDGTIGPVPLYMAVMQDAGAKDADDAG